MKQLDINAYIEGRLSGSALESFESEMRRDSQLQEQVNYLRQLTDDIEMVVIDEGVRSILKDKNFSGEQPKNKGRWFGLLVGIAVMLFTVNTFWKKETAQQPIAPVEKEQIIQPEKSEPVENEIVVPPETPTIQKNEPTKDQQPAIKKQSSTPSKKKETPPKKPAKKHYPIAQNTEPAKLAPPLYPAPNVRNVRGGNADKEEWKTLLDKIWYTDFPPTNTTFNEPYTEAANLLKERNFKKAFLKLEMAEMKMEANDTLRFLKGYCLLEMGEGGDAVRYMEQMENPSTDWQASIEWYKGLGVLISKGTEEAVPFFKEIAAKEKHEYQRQSEKVLEIIEIGN